MSVLDIINAAPPAQSTAADVDAYLRGERASWSKPTTPDERDANLAAALAEVHEGIDRPDADAPPQPQQSKQHWMSNLRVPDAAHVKGFQTFLA